MGAFGRSRLREWVLGGATRTVLDFMHVPVLMAH
jgi:nucleotide-binding universal stress UspA family protein